MDQRIDFAARRHTTDGLPVYQGGDTVAGTVTIVPDRDARTRGVQMWVGCQIHGSGTSESVELLPEQFVHEGDIQAGTPISASFEVELPADVPISYEGRRVKFTWEVRLRVDVPIWPDKRLSFPFLVEPRRAER